MSGSGPSREPITESAGAGGRADIAALVRTAREAQAQAWAPYSRFRVGAVLVAEDGRAFVGCNVENASYPAGICAERGALCAAIAAGARAFTHVVIVSDADTPTPPCGICRQALVEFAPALEVVTVAANGLTTSWSLADLLPFPFTPSSLAHA
jgi:cytidine deaminase